MLTKERILELLGNAPEKLERWEQEIILLENSSARADYITHLLSDYKIPYKKKSHYNLMHKEDYDKREKGISRNTIIELAKKYKIRPSSILTLHKNPSKCYTRKLPSKNEVLAFYNNWIKTKGTSIGWTLALGKEYGVNGCAVRRFLKTRGVILPNTNLWNSEKKKYLEELIEEVKHVDVYTKVKNCYEYIVKNFCNRYPQHSRQSVLDKVKLLHSNLHKDVLILQQDFIQNLLNNRDKSIPKGKMAAIWAKKYPIRTENVYRSYLADNAVNKPIEYRKYQRAFEKEHFLNLLPKSLTEEQKKQIIKAYEKAVH